MSDVTATIIGVRASLATALVAGVAASMPQAALIEATWGGIKLWHVVFGSVGAAITLSVVQGWTWARVAMTLMTGLGTASFGTPFLLHYLPPPEALAAIGESAYAALLGAVGVYAIPGLHNAARAFAGNPWGFVDWVRGRGAPPQPPPPPEEGGKP